jgi:hypothetical protein
MKLRAVLAMAAIGLGCVVLSGLAGGRLPALGTALWIADLLGWCAFILLLLLVLLPLRRRPIEAPPLVAHSTHRLAGYLMLVLVIVHAAASLFGEPASIAYWLPTAPLYMLLGQASAAVLVALCWMTALSVRARRYGAGSNFHPTHLLLSLAVLALSLAHVAGSAAIAFSAWRLMPWALLSAAAVLLPLRSPAQPARPPLRLVSVAAILAATLALAMPFLTLPLQSVPLQADSRLPLVFPHLLHSDTNCVTCHHNVADGTPGPNACIACHRGPRSDLVLSVQPRFHRFCEGCHRERQLEGRPHGPLRACGACHPADGRSTML